MSLGGLGKRPTYVPRTRSARGDHLPMPPERPGLGSCDMGLAGPSHPAYVDQELDDVGPPLRSRLSSRWARFWQTPCGRLENAALWALVLAALAGWAYVMVTIGIPVG